MCAPRQVRKLFAEAEAEYESRGDDSAPLPLLATAEAGGLRLLTRLRP